MVPLPEITSPSDGLPRQPIPLRLVPLITGFSVEELLRLLVERPLEDYDHPDPILTAYEYRPNERIRDGCAQVYSALRAEVAAEKGLRKKLQLLPANEFVWSDELATAVDLIRHFDLSHEKYSGQIELNWDVSPGPFRKLIEECPEFPGGAIRRSRQAQRKQDTAKRHSAWQKQVLEVAKQHPNRSHSYVCKVVAQNLNRAAGAGRKVDPESIRRVTRLPAK